MKRAFTVLECIIVICILALVAVLLLPIIARINPSPRRAICNRNLKQIGLGFAQYEQDYGERFPPARLTATVGWKDAVFPYVKSVKAEEVFQCPAAFNTKSPLTDYFYNRRLARQKIEALDFIALTILSGDGADDAPTWNSIADLPPTWNSIADLPPAWKAISGAPARRHLDGANYLFADGHVKLLQPSRVTTTSAAQGYNATFAMK